MTTTNKLDLRTCPLQQLCEWVAREIMGWEFWTGDGVWLVPHRGPSDTTPEIHFRSLDAVAAVEAKAREGRLKGWNVEWWRSAQNLNHECPFFCGWYGTNEETYYRSAEVHAPTEPEARLRACALAWEAAKP